MPVWFRSFIIFGLMVAAPLLLEGLFNARSGWLARLGFNNLPLIRAFPFALAVLIIAGIFLVAFLYDRLHSIASCLTVAERDLNSLLSSALEHGGRKARAAERSEWNLMNIPPEAQIFAEGYRTVAHELVAANERELAGKGAALGRASITAFLLRELYEGNIEAAQSKILADLRNSGQLPYLAPGIRELLGFDRFNPETDTEPGTAVWWFPLELAVLIWGFPRHILMVKTSASGERRELRNWDVLNELTMQKP